jgi:hypothetical protein
MRTAKLPLAQAMWLNSRQRGGLKIVHQLVISNAVPSFLVSDPSSTIETSHQESRATAYRHNGRERSTEGGERL